MDKVFIILCDTLRAKSLPHYGNQRMTLPLTGPLLDKDFTVYSRAYAPSPWTIPSHLSLFTGLYPTQVLENSNSFYLNPVFTTMADLFRDSGYRTAGFSTNGFIGKRFGYEKGFDRFYQMWLPDPLQDDLLFNLGADNDIGRVLEVMKLFINSTDKKLFTDSIRQKIYKRVNNIFNNSTPSTDRCMDYLRKFVIETEAEKTFCFVNLMQAHEKHNPPKCMRNKIVPYNKAYEKYYQSVTLQNHYAHEHFAPEFMQYLRGLYEENILYLDLSMSDFFQYLKEAGIYDSSTVIITSDHGEHFGENGHYAHSFSVYEPVITIPLYVKWPGKSENRERVNNQLVMLHDLYATFQDSLDHWLPVPDSSVSLLSSGMRSWTVSQFPDISHNIEGCVRSNADFTLADVGLQYNGLTAYVLADGRKFIRNGDAVKAYRLDSDPEESYPEEVDALPEEIIVIDRSCE
ncbi:MAG: sulfatase-like hydrolase/transferase [Nitrospira sp.]|nr:sulfatase-like hydrolase/transferase [bacterium]MBL7049269.1 sulfatase-like hydrolase/transferase [Nitrospira sp.]